MKILASWWLCLCLCIPSVTHAEVLWKSDFEEGDLSEWSGKLNPDKDGKRTNIEVVAAPVFAGMHAVQITIHPDDLWPGNMHNRVELHQDGQRTKEGQTTFLSWHFMLHDNVKVHDDIGYWETNTTYQQTMAFYLDPTATGMTLGFRTNRQPAKEHFKRPLTAKVWHQIAMQILWSTDATKGRVNVWLDGEQVARDVSAQTKPDGNDLFLQVGFHRDATQAPVETISIDDAIEGTSLDDVLTKPMMPVDAGIAEAGLPDPVAGDDAGLSADASVDGSTPPDTQTDAGAQATPGAPSTSDPATTNGDTSKVEGCQVVHRSRAPWLLFGWLGLIVAGALRRRSLRV